MISSFDFSTEDEEDDGPEFDSSSFGHPLSPGLISLVFPPYLMRVMCCCQEGAA